MEKDHPANNINSDLILDSLNLIVISTDANGDITYISPYTTTVLGFVVNNDLKKNWWEKACLFKEDITLNKQKITNILSGKITAYSKPYISKINCKNGNYKYIEWRDSLNNDNTFTSIGIEIIDKNSDEIVTYNSDAIVNSVNAMIFVSDADGNIIYSSPSVEKMLGYTPNEILGNKWWEITYENEYEAENVKKAIHNFVYNNIKEFTDITKRKIKTKDGNFKWIEWQISKGINNTYISVGSDITSKVLTDEELNKAKETAEKSLKVKDEFLANMSHEIRTPLNAVIGFTDLLLETSLNVEQREHLETMRNSGEILLSLINNVLDLAKLDSNKVEIENISFDLHKNLYEVVKLMKLKASEKNIALELEIDQNTPQFVLGDPTRLGQILLNLIGNAIKFTNEGSVAISVKNMNVEGDFTQVYFEIKDTGIGIVSNKISTVFGVFTQAKSDTSRIYGGSGLGLAIVKKLVHLFDGEIKVHSKFGVGSIFKMTLPFKVDATKVSGDLSEDHLIENVNLGLNILLVEDNKTNQLLAKTRLERWSCTVDIANNGIEGVKKVQHKLYDIILMDIQMPVMDGYEATKIIKNDLSKKAAKIPIIAMTAYTSKNDISRAFEVGMDDYIFKPFKKEDLFALLKKYGNVSTKYIENNHKEELIIVKDEKYTDLTFLKEESLQETSILLLLIELFLKDLEEYKLDLEKCLKNKDWEQLHRATHKIKPNVSMFGIAKMVPIVHSLMNFHKKADMIINVETQVEKCILIIELVKIELQNELKILKND